MRIFNYSNYAKALEVGLNKIDKTEMANTLFEPLIDCEVVEVFNKNNDMYYFDSSKAKKWYDKKEDIPISIKTATSDDKMTEHVIDYFQKQIIGKYINNYKIQEVFESMTKLIESSNLLISVKQELLKYYQNKQYAEFLGKSFLYAVNQNNTLQDTDDEFSSESNQEIKKFDNMVFSYMKKPSIITPPKEIKPDELGYVEELYRVYSEKTGKECTCEQDLDKFKDLKKNFNSQRKNYYSAETIRRELRDTIPYNEEDDFEILKDEIFDGIIDVRDEDYSLAYERLKAVMKHVTKVQTSPNLNAKLLGWVGPAEKKGVCHMLVNDNRIKWMEDEDDDETE